MPCASAVLRVDHLGQSQRLGLPWLLHNLQNTICALNSRLKICSDLSSPKSKSISPSSGSYHSRLKRHLWPDMHGFEFVNQHENFFISQPVSGRKWQYCQVSARLSPSRRLSRPRKPPLERRIHIKVCNVCRSPGRIIPGA